MAHIHDQTSEKHAVSARYDARKHSRDTSVSSSMNHQPPTTLRQKIWHHLTADVRQDLFTEIELLILTLCTGIANSTTFLDYHCFASNQSGNTVLLGFSVMNVGAGRLFEPKIIGVCFICFLLGNLLVAQIGHRWRSVGPRTRWWVVGTNFLSTGCLSAAAGLQYVYGVDLKEATISMACIALISLSCGLQTVLSRAFECNEISTGFATAAWVDLVVDPNLLAKDNRARNRRLAFLLVLFLGALVGACMYKYVGRPFPLVMAATGKALVTVLYLFNPSEKGGEDGQESMA